ncbi:MAG: hypothetical protein V1767_03930 [Chloroflexota bacterium]
MGKLGLIVAAFVLFSFPIGISGCTPSTPPTIPTTPAAPTTPTTSTVKADWVLIERTDDNFTVTIPKTWSNLDPSLTEPMGFIFFAVDPQKNPAATRYPGSFSISKTTLKEVPTIDQVESANMKDLQSSPEISDPVSKRVQLSFGESVQIRYKNNLKRTDGSVETVEFLQYYFVNGKDIYLFTFETVPALAEKYVPIFLEIASSFKFMK